MQRIEARIYMPHHAPQILDLAYMLRCR